MVFGEESIQILASLFNCVISHFIIKFFLGSKCKSVMYLTQIFWPFCAFFKKCICVHMMIGGTQYGARCGGQRTSLCTWFSPSTSVWVQGIELRSADLGSKCFTSWAIYLPIFSLSCCMLWSIKRIIFDEVQFIDLFLLFHVLWVCHLRRLLLPWSQKLTPVPSVA